MFPSPGTCVLSANHLVVPVPRIHNAAKNGFLEIVNSDMIGVLHRLARLRFEAIDISVEGTRHISNLEVWCQILKSKERYDMGESPAARNMMLDTKALGTFHKSRLLKFRKVALSDHSPHT
jgi:hypothetical protein